MAAIIGDLTITTGDGTVLSSGTDVGLAWEWAEHEVNARPDEFPGGWAELSHGQQCEHAGEALRELRRALGATDGN